MSEQAEAFDGGAADDIALVLAELPEQPGGQANLRRRSGSACDDKAEMPAGARFGDGRFGEDRGNLRCVSGEESGVLVRDAARYVGGADALLGVIGAQYGDKFPRRTLLVWTSEQALCVRAGGCKAPGRGLPKIDLHAGSSVNIHLQEPMMVVHFYCACSQAWTICARADRH